MRIFFSFSSVTIFLERQSSRESCGSQLDFVESEFDGLMSSFGNTANPPADSKSQQEPTISQGCRMVYFLTKNPYLGKF
jgi:hypothetical protein